MDSVQRQELDATTTQTLLEELRERGQRLVAEGRKQAGSTLVNRANYLLDHMPGAVLLYRPDGK